MKRTLPLLLLICLGFQSIAQNKIMDLKEAPNALRMMGKKWGTMADSSTFYQWNNGAWEAKNTKVYSYNSSDEIDVILEYNAQSGILDHRYTYSYDNEGRLIRIDMDGYNGSGFDPINRYFYNFDSEGNRIAFRTESYVNGFWTIDEGDSIAYSYDSEKRITEMNMFQYSNNSIYPIQKLLFDDFTPDDLPGTLTVQAFQGSYVNYIQMKFLSWRTGFDPVQIRPTSYHGYLWQNGSWLLASYDSAIVTNGKMDVDYLYQYDGNKLDTLGKTTYRYDKLGKTWETIAYNYAMGNWVASNGTRDSNTYGSYDEIQEQVSSSYTNATQEWINLGKEKFYYNSLSVAALPTKTLEFYPNPTRRFIYLKMEDNPATIQLISSSGKVMTLENRDGKIDLDGITPGIYFMRLESKHQIYTGRVQVTP